MFIPYAWNLPLIQIESNRWDNFTEPSFLIDFKHQPFIDTSKKDISKYQFGL